MSVLFAWIPSDKDCPTESVLTGMGAALRSRPEERESRWSEPGFGIGRLTTPRVDERGDGETEWAPAEQGHFKLWMVGEVFSGRRVEVESPEASRTLAFRQRLLKEVLDRGLEIVSSLDGEFWVALWDVRKRVLQLANDRFGGLPLYYGESANGAAIASGVRGVLMAPGIDSSADPEAIREAVTFGGFRLGGRTNVASVQMLAGGSIFTLDGRSIRHQRYWSFKDIPPIPEQGEGELLEQASTLWNQAIERRIQGSGRFGQTLSGGLDSRAILAEAAPRKPTWTTLSYGVPDCDDVRYGKRAAAVSGAEWRYYDIYRNPEPNWLASRSEHIHRTDGMINLLDLLHVESVATQAEHMDVHMSGYIGDAVCGPTFARVETPEDVMASMPFYGYLAMTHDEARDLVSSAIDRLDGAPLRYALFDNKLPQSTNRWATAWRPWFTVRKPFVDYDLFDFWQGLPVRVRLEDNLYERWLLKRYPEHFANIPNQTTGVPILTPQWRYQLTRIGRFAWRRCAPFFGVSPKSRYYFDVANHWTTPGNRARIEETILRPGSLSAEICGREKLTSFLNGWFDEGNGPTQVVAALYVYEHFHRDLAAHLRAAAN